jgi:hypothetical protein
MKIPAISSATVCLKLMVIESELITISFYFLLGLALFMWIYFHDNENCHILLSALYKRLVVFSQPGCNLPNSPWPGIIKLFPPMESLVNDIPAGNGNVANLF